MERKVYVYGFEFGFDNPKRSFNGFAIFSPIHEGESFTRVARDGYELVDAVNGAFKRFPDSALISSIPRIPIYLGDSMEIYAGGQRTDIAGPDEAVNRHIATMDLSTIEKIIVRDGSMHYVYRNLTPAEIPEDMRSYFREPALA
jgi:hypothetical protein